MRGTQRQSKLPSRKSVIIKKKIGLATKQMESLSKWEKRKKNID